MTPDAVIRAWFKEVWNDGNEDAIDRYFALDGIAHGLPSPDGTPLTGPSSFKPFVKHFKQFPEYAD
jgi:hypothetical protein